MRPNTKQATILEALLVLGLLMIALAGCGASSSASAPQQGEQSTEEAGSSRAGNFVGTVEGTDAFVVVDGEDRALAYVCDGREDGDVSVAEWFTGAVADDGPLDLTGKGGSHLVAGISEDGTEGTITLGGEEHAFSLEPVEEPAGPYRTEKTVDGEEYVGGGIVLPSEESRGAISSRSAGFVSSNIDFAGPGGGPRFTDSPSSVGSLEVQRADGFVGGSIDL